MQASDLMAPKAPTTTIVVPPSVLSTTEKKPAADSTTETSDDKKSGKTAGKLKTVEDPAFTISESMEKLLDGLTGGTTDIQNDPAVLRAQQAERMMRGIQQMSRAVTEATTRALDMIKGDLGRTLGGFGMPADRINDVLGAFDSHLQDKLKGLDFGGVSLDITQSSTQMTLESRGIDLVIEDGDRKMSISFAKSTLQFAQDDQRLQAELGKDGSFSFAFGQNSVTANAKATGMIVKADGFSAEEIEGVLEKLNGMLDTGALSGMNGTAVIRPEKTSDGILKLKLDLSVVLGGESADGAATASPAQGQDAAKVNVLA
ncbi:hypothetical protein [Azospirillum sp. A39]|uniref:hypothetical protein n=1 Tax=Azospirillum sp. A39 TaxID=3462279 RepID=UPI004045591F